MSIALEHVAELLKEFDEINAISGFETPVARRMTEKLKGITQSQTVDTLGNCICVKEGKPGGKKILLSAHMDEIGFLVCDITDDGLVSAVPVGMHNPAMVVNQVMSIHTREKGTVYAVLAGGVPVHFAKEQAGKTNVGDLRFDVGCTTAEEVRALGVRVGDPMNIEKESHMLGKYVFSGKAVDNRSGVVTLLLAMELLAGEETDATVYCCGTVQEEIGIKGARTLVQHLAPDVAVAVDVGFAAEGKELNPNCTRFYQGKGPSLQLYDWSPNSMLGNIVPRVVSDGLAAAAEKAGVAYQEHVNLCGGTDAAELSLSNGGLLTGSISLPEKYMHTTVGTMDLRDVAGAAELLAQYVRDLK